MGRPENRKQTISILGLCEDRTIPKKIADILKIKQSSLSRKLKILVKKNLLKKQGHFYSPTGLARIILARSEKDGISIISPCVRKLSIIPTLHGNIVRYHDLKVKIPILVKGQHTEALKSVEINNWIKEYHSLEIPIPITLEITTRSVILNFHQKEFENTLETRTKIQEWTWKGIAGASYFLAQFGTKLDLLNAQVISQHIATEGGEADKVVPEQIVLTKGLGRPSTSPIGKTNINAKAWLERSRGPLEIETNDLTYEEKLLMMPEYMALILARSEYQESIITRFTAQMELHLDVQTKTSHSLDGVDKGIRELTEVVKRLSKEDMPDWAKKIKK